MFPGFVTRYIDNNGKSHVYFFPGIDEDGNNIYKELEIKSELPFFKNILSDGAIDFIFNCKIHKVTCTLIPINKNLDIKEINI